MPTNEEIATQLSIIGAKQDRMLFLMEDERVGVCTRVKRLEEVTYGNGGPGLTERVRTLEASDKEMSAHSATLRASGVSLGLLAVWEIVKRKMGWG